MYDIYWGSRWRQGSFTGQVTPVTAAQRGFPRQRSFACLVTLVIACQWQGALAYQVSRLEAVTRTGCLQAVLVLASTLPGGLCAPAATRACGRFVDEMTLCLMEVGAGFWAGGGKERARPAVQAQRHPLSGRCRPVAHGLEPPFSSGRLGPTPSRPGPSCFKFKFSQQALSCSFLLLTSTPMRAVFGHRSTSGLTACSPVCSA